MVSICNKHLYSLVNLLIYKKNEIDDDEESMEVLCLPELTRVFSDQKKKILSGMVKIIMRAFYNTESAINFKDLI